MLVESGSSQVCTNCASLTLILMCPILLMSSPNLLLGCPYGVRVVLLNIILNLSLLTFYSLPESSKSMAMWPEGCASFGFVEYLGRTSTVGLAGVGTVPTLAAISNNGFIALCFGPARNTYYVNDKQVGHTTDRHWTLVVIRGTQLAFVKPPPPQLQSSLKSVRVWTEYRRRQDWHGHCV